ncbi:COG1470 family protein [Streptomyces lavendulae]|uniref:COG1470 family protein n=1 Tax=Streptomyces lavendulae TaxID=1914 RepID=UPI0038180711
MSVRAELTVPGEVITPGESLTARLRVWNDSRIVDAYRLRLIGPPAQWPDAEADLGRLPVYPGSHEQICVPLTLPRDSGLLPGPLTFAVQVSSLEDPAAVTVPEAAIEVGAFHDVELSPGRSRVGGALWSSNLITLENTGNASTGVRLRVAPQAEDAPVRVRLRRTRLSLAPGERARVSLITRVVNPVVVGTASNWRITVRAGWDGTQERTCAFVHRRRPVLTKPALKALIALIVALVAFAVLWISPVGGKRPEANSESAKGPSQLEAVRQAEKETAEGREKEREEKERQEREQADAGAPKKKPFRLSLTTDTKAGEPTDTLTVDKGYRLVVKTVQITSSGPANGTLILRTGKERLVSQSITAAKDYTPAAPLSLAENGKLILEVTCPPAATSPSQPPAGSPEAAPSGPVDCLATAVVTGELIPLRGPDAEPANGPSAPPSSPPARS